MARKTASAKSTKATRSANDTEADHEPRGSAGPGRGIWSGSISFGLLQIPVTLFTAETRIGELHFRLLDKENLVPIKYERVSSATGKAVPWNAIVKGFEIEKDEFVVLDPEDLAKANVRATQTVDIQDFVPADDIDPAFYETPYFVVPQKRSTKAYVLLRDALTHQKAAAIATFVLRTREHLCALLPVGDAIMLETLRFGHELKRASDMPLPSPGDAELVSAREQQMAEQLVQGMMTAWDPSRYKDRYHADVMAIIEEKAKTGTTKKHDDEIPGKVASDVVDLLDLLKRSVETRGAPAPEKAAAKRRPRKPHKERAA